MTGTRSRATPGDRTAVGRPDLVFTLFADTWNDAVQRGCCFTLDRCVLAAANDPRVGRVSVVNAPRWAPGQAVRRLQGRRPAPAPAGVRVVQPLRLQRRDPTDTAAARRTYARLDRSLGRIARSLGVENPVVVTGSPLVAAFCDLRWAGSVTYYGYDDWAALEELRPWWPLIDEAYRHIASSGRRVAAVSAPILERIEPLGPGEVIPNGVDPDEFDGASDPPPWTLAIERPLILYVGNIGGRLDVDSLVEVARRNPGGTVVLAGAVGDPDVLRRLERLRNVRHVGALGRAEVIPLVRTADVCVMPHLETRLTRSMSPLKLYEYVAAGRPVVATDLPPVRAVDPGIITVPAGRPTEFADGVDEALARGPVAEPERRRWVADNSWRRRFDALLDLAVPDRGR